MSEEGKELYDGLKQRINRLTQDGTDEKQFVDFWRIACTAKYRSHDIKYLYDDSSREFIEKYKDQLVKMREDFIENIDYYVDKCMNVMRKTCNFKVFLARTNEEAQKIFKEEVGKNQTVYKSCSSEALDIGLMEFSKKNDIKIIETALGDKLDKWFEWKHPPYLLGGGVQFTPEEIAAKIKELYGDEIEPDPQAITFYVRDKFRPDMLKNVQVALTSANAVAADDGSIFICENSGNISLITRLAEKHIVVVGITKIVPTFFDACLVTKTLSRINKVSQAYISIIAAPSNTSSVQGKSVQGMYGAREVVVIFVDDWRKKAVKEDLIYEDLLKCVGCKTCDFICTASRAFGNVFGSRYGLGATGIIREYIHHGIEAAVKAGLFLCTGCEKCTNWCPVGTDLAEMMKSLKKEATDEGLCPPPLQEYREKILKNKNPFN
jgi:L-lactate dehydrogenase complex protein LldG